VSEYKVFTPTPHGKQAKFIVNRAKRRIIRAGRRSGKTVGVTICAIDDFLDGNRVLYAAPTSEQLDRFWTTVTRALAEPIQAKVFYKNETEHIIELLGTEQRIRAKTAWNADTLRGDYANKLILDEFQLMNEDTWAVVGAPMLLDKDGDAIFIYTPPSLHSRSVSKANDPQHAAKMFKRAQQDTSGRWAWFHFTSHDNPHISKQAIGDLARDMTSVAYRMEIMAEDIDEAPGALWKRADIDAGRVIKASNLARLSWVTREYIEAHVCQAVEVEKQTIGLAIWRMERGKGIGALVVLVLVLLQVACAVSAAAVPVPSPTVLPGTGASNHALLGRQDKAVCAIVTAEVAVNLRAGQGSETAILRHLFVGQLVTVLDTQNLDWWKVWAGEEGFVRSKYLRIVECEQ